MNAEPSKAPEAAIKEPANVMKGFLSDEDQRCYSAVVVTAEADSTADRLPRQLAFGIPTILVRPAGMDHSEEFWYPNLQDRVNVFYATPDTLESVLQTVLEKDKKLGEEVGKAGRDFVDKTLAPDRVKCYLYEMLSKYSRFYSASQAVQ